MAIQARAAWPVALPNEGFEQIGRNGQPVGWQHVNYWSQSTFKLETARPHSGRYAVCIHGAPQAQGYMQLVKPVDVFPGEMLEAGAWVKLSGVPANESATIAADFIDTDGQSKDSYFQHFVNISGNSPASRGWTWVHGTIKAPPMAAKMWVRLGFYKAQGTACFDDVQVVSDTPVGCRIDLPWGELLPSMGDIPVEIINRTGENLPLTVAAELRSGGRATRSVAAIVCSDKRTVHIPFHIDERGKVLATVKVFNDHHQELASDSRMLTIPPAVRMSPPIPTDWAVEDGPPHITGDIYLAVTKEELQRATLEVRLVDHAGATEARWMADMQRPLENGVMHYELNAPALAVGNYTVIAEYRAAGEKPVHMEEALGVLPRRLESSSINADGYLVYDGKAIFPLGIFNGDARVKEMGKAGFTINQAYNACNVTIGQPPDDAAALRFLNQTERNGMKAIFLVPREYVFHGKWYDFRRRIRMFKNHPALVAWDEEEGIARGDLSPAGLKKMVQIIHEEDPNHPIMIGDSREEVEHIKDRSNFFPVKEMDLGMWWWYPIPPVGNGTALNGDEDTNGAELIPPSFLVRRNTNKPLWVGVQAYDKKGEDP
ncbi:MAG TPA: hypothetical protein VG722_12765, partial [Tepidisphaeraceae bacterium]|nr:hypothetical protein [Tepidisphaeraceae bacterium]